MAAKEGRIVAAIIGLLRAKGAYCEKNHGSMFARRGRPDIEGCYKGRYFALEVKAPGGKPTALQLAALEEIKAAGGIAAVVYSIEEGLNAVFRGAETSLR